MIVAKKLTKKYGHREAISNVSFTVNKGEVVGFLGPNGAGKTTTMKILTGYMSPFSGSVEINNTDLFTDPINVKKHIGYLPETPPVYGEMPVEGYLQYAAKLKLCEKNKIKSLVESAMEKTGLTDVRSRLIQNLSKGFRQRVGLAQALVSDPEILILDEPTVGLDPNQVIEMRELLSQLKGQHTIILSTHILPEVQASCDRVIIINEGKIIAEDSLDGLGKKMEAKSQVLLSVQNPSQELINQLKQLDFVTDARKHKDQIEIDVTPKQGANESIAKTVISGGYGLLELKNTKFNLEDVFISLTHKKGQ